MTTPLSQDELLAVAARFLPEGYLLPLKLVGPGYELLQANAAALARVSQAVCDLEAQTFSRTASTASVATAQVAFLRPNPIASVITLRAGTVVADSATGRKFVLLEDQVIDGSTTFYGPVTVTALVAGAEFNDCRGPRTAADGSTIVGSIDAIYSLVTDPDYADPTLTVTQVEDADGGGAADHLSQVGSDLGQPRFTNEDVVAYRARLGQLPDTISPAAIRRLLAVSFTAAYGPAYAARVSIVEPWFSTFQTAWDVPNTASLAPTDALHDATLNSVFAYDDTRIQNDPNTPPNGFWGAWLCEDDRRGSVIVVVPLVLTALDPIGIDGNPYYDGAADPTRNAFYAGLWAALKASVAGGVTLRVVHPWP
jgi:hypothetical protein